MTCTWLHMLVAVFLIVCALNAHHSADARPHPSGEIIKPARINKRSMIPGMGSVDLIEDWHYPFNVIPPPIFVASDINPMEEVQFSDFPEGTV